MKKIKNKSIEIHVGSGASCSDGWINIDNGYDKNTFKIDLTKQLPFKEKEVDFIYYETYLKDFTTSEIFRILREFRRILKSNGTLQIAVSRIDESSSENKKIEEILKEVGFKDIKCTKPNSLKNINTKRAKTINKSELILEALGEEPILTVFVLTYNHKNYIKRALDSILFQKTNFIFKILLIDDCSTDGTTEICKEYANQYPDKIEFISHHQNMGSVNAGHEGALKINTPYFMSLDGDDYWIDENKLQIQIELLDENQDCVICGHNSIIKYKDKEGKIVNIPNLNLLEKFSLENNVYLHTSSRLYRKVINFEDYPKDLLTDAFFYHAMLDKGKCIYLDRVMSVYDCTNSTSSWATLSPLEQIRDNDAAGTTLLEFFNFKYEDYFIKAFLCNSALYIELNKKTNKKRSLKLYRYINKRILTKKIKKEKDNIENLKDDKIKLNIGCEAKYLDGWINIDNMSSNNPVKYDLQWDLTKPLMFEDHSVDVIFDGKFIERLNLDRTLMDSNFNTFRRILKPSGLLLIGLLNMNIKEPSEKILNQFGFNNIEFYPLV